jgi:TonB family protein
MIADILHGLVRANIAAGLAVAAILPLRPLARRWLGAQTAYGLWLVAPLAAAGAFLPARKIVLMQTAATAPLPHTITATFVATDYSPLLFGLWVAGVALSLAVLAERQRRFRASLGRLTPVRDGTLLAEHNRGPAVLGALIPRIVLPVDFEVQFSAAERQAILAHERTHLAAGHAQTNGLIAVIQSLCWFNPLAYVASRALRQDQELACDAAVLSRSTASPRLYGEALLRTQLNAPPLPLGCYWPSTGLKSLKERLLMLKKPLPNRRVRLAGAGLIGLAAVGGAVAAWAAQPAQVKIIDLLANQEKAKAYATTFLQDKLAATTDPAERKALSDRLVSIQAHTSEDGVIVTPATGLVLTHVAQTAPQVSTRNSFSLPAAASSAPPQYVVTEPDWLERPTGGDLQHVYPERARRMEKDGRVAMRCVVTEIGSVTECAVVQETPDGFGFGEAALAMAMAMADKFKMSPATLHGAPVAGGVVIIPIMFAGQ